jgi:tetratricopeptide (TPR) repeat protein
MKRIGMFFVVMFLLGATHGFAQEVPAVHMHRIDYGDYRSVTLVTKAWDALKANDLQSVLTYTNKCIEFYGAQASKMEASLKDYATGTNDQIFKYWALNDVGTSYFIQGEAYRAAGMNKEAIAAYKKVIHDFTYAQCWDTQGFFWKPAEGSKPRMDFLITGK